MYTITCLKTVTIMHRKIKRTVIKVLCLIGLTAVTAGCGNNTSNNKILNPGNINTDGCAEITFNSQTKRMPFDSVITDISFIKLETNDSCLIGKIDQVLYTDRYIYVMDIEIANAVYCFDKQGRFVRRIGKVGNGPGEYPRLCQMALTADGKQLVIYDWAYYHYYDLEGNRIKDEFVADNLGGQNMVFIRGATIVYYSGGSPEAQDCMVKVYDEQKELIYYEFPTFRTKHFRTTPTMLSLYNFGGNAYWNAPWTEDIYRIGADKCYKAYHLNIENGGYPPLDDDTDDDTYRAMRQNRLCLDRYAVLSGHALFWLHSLKSKQCAIYSHKTKKTYLITPESSNPLIPSFIFYNEYPEVCDTHTYLISQPTRLVLFWKEAVYKMLEEQEKKDPKVDQLYEGLTEDSNPVLFLFTVNEKL